MPIEPLLESEAGAFGPDDIASITSAFERSLHRLGLVDLKDPAVILVAKTTLEIAKHGERDPILLSDAMLKRMGN